MIELLPASIGIGLVISLMLQEALGMAGAGLVVPGYLALHLQNPASVAVTLICGFAAYGIVKLAGAAVILYGRRRNILMILAGYLTGMTGRQIAGAALLGGEMYAVIGFIIPGLIAIWLDRRGVIESLCSLITAAVLVRLILILIFGAGLDQ